MSETGILSSKSLPLAGLHSRLGARMVPFAGWNMPVQYPMGVMAEHSHTRSAAGLFDVSHMGQVLLHGPKAAQALETLVPADILGLAPGRQRYALFTNDDGGILDDLMVANRGDHLFLVVNAARAEHDIAHLVQHLTPLGVRVEPLPTRALLALQGPGAESALAQLLPDVAKMRFMDVAVFASIWVSRSGYTGEDGFEISLPVGEAEAFAERLLAQPDVAPIGLGARDSLRLEAGLCLYGHDIDEGTTPSQAGLLWSIGKARRPGGDRAGGYPGAERVAQDLAQGPSRLRVGLAPEGRAPMREGVLLWDAAEGGTCVGAVTSGGFGPSCARPIAMGYVPQALAASGTPLWGDVRGKRLPLTVAPLPFVPANFKR